MNKERIDWDGKIDSVKIETCSSGAWKIVIETNFLNDEEMQKMIKDIIKIRNVRDSVKGR